MIRKMIYISSVTLLMNRSRVHISIIRLWSIPVAVAVAVVAVAVVAVAVAVAAVALTKIQNKQYSPIILRLCCFIFGNNIDFT